MNEPDIIVRKSNKIKTKKLTSNLFFGKKLMLIDDHEFKVSQNKIQVIVSVFVNFLVAIDVTANPIAQSAAAIIAGLKVLKSGLATINMPRKPSKIAARLMPIIRPVLLFLGSF